MPVEAKSMDVLQRNWTDRDGPTIFQTGERLNRKDIEIVEGDRDRPGIVFIHGLGMDKRIWVSPDEARILAGGFPIHILLCKRGFGSAPFKKRTLMRRRLIIGAPDCELHTVFHDLRKEGYTLIAWSQMRPAAPVDVVVNELRDILNLSERFTPSGFILIGHSRGGLIGRRYLHLHKDRRVKALITISTPHSGTKMATFVKYISPIASFVRPLVSGPDRGRVLNILKRMSDFLTSRAVIELLPDSYFIRSLDDSRMDGVKYLSIGGKSPSLLCIKRIIEVYDGNRKRVRMERIISFPDAIERFVPQRLLPEEIRRGEGDGLVSIESSRIPWTSEHYNFNLNHAEILFSTKVRRRLFDKITEMTG